MNSEFFKGIFNTELAAFIPLSSLLLCVGCALLCGIIISVCYVFKARYTVSFVATLALLPSVVAVVIMAVNGNIGTGIAVAGTFSLVRFRSVPGTAREIGSIFLAMGAGLVVGIGYLGYALLISALLGAASLIYNLIGALMCKKSTLRKKLRITIPEDLDYTDVFEEILCEYTSQHELVKVKTTNMGSLFRLTYNVTVKDASKEKELIDKLRVRNGNLEITVSQQETSNSEL